MFDVYECDSPIVATTCQGEQEAGHLATAACDDIADVSNDDFLTAIFGNSVGEVRPLVCKKPGNPDVGGWKPQPLPCNTADADCNWYFLPGLYRPDESGVYRAKKEFAVCVKAVMVDDVCTKIDAQRFDNCPPSWAIETSPGNFQYGFIFREAITEVAAADALKERLIAARLSDPGASGGAARWMRLPRAINGRSKYGNPSPLCKLTQWRPDLKYTVEELDAKLGLSQPHVQAKQTLTRAASPGGTATPLDTDSNVIIAALNDRGLYKKQLSVGKHDITCPWVAQHTDATDDGAAYFEPDLLHPKGGFKCHHSHGELYHISDLKEFLGVGLEADVNTQEDQPQKLPSALRNVASLETEVLPQAIRDAVMDQAERLQCPPDYLAVAMLSVAGTVVGNGIGIFPYANDESWEVYPAIWGGIVGDPGSKKSPALQTAHVPLRHLESLAAQKYSQELQVYKVTLTRYEKELATWNKNKSSGIKPVAPTEPKLKRFVVHDSTYQALGKILADNPSGVLALADELSGLLQSLDTTGQEAARGFYLSGWSGTGGYSFDRVERGHISLSRFCLSVFGGFQPDRIKAYVQQSQGGSTKNDGLLQRFQLLVWPDAVGNFQFVDRTPNQAAIDQYHQAIFRLNQSTRDEIPGAKRLPNGSQLLHFSPEAQELYGAWYVKNENMLAKGALDSARQSHYAKYRSLIPALALLFHLLDAHDGPVCLDCLSRAIMFAKYLKSHAERIYASVSGHDHAAIRLLAERLLSGQLGNGFTCRTLTLKGWAGLRTKEQAQAAVNALVDYGWLIEEATRGIGRPTTKYNLHPSASAAFL